MRYFSHVLPWELLQPRGVSTEPLAGAHFETATAGFPLSPPAKRGEKAGERIPRMSRSRLEPLNRAAVNVGQCVSPAPFSAVTVPVHLILDGAGETHCPTLRFMGRGTDAMAGEGSGFPA